MGINGFLLAFAIFIVIAMSIYWGFFEEWTIWTDYTMAWVKRSINDANLCCTALGFRLNSTFSSTIGIV
jgi:myo-inositol catabolism protein IolC